MSRTFHHHGERPIRARGVRRDPPDLRRLARAVIALAEAQTEADALAANQDSASAPPPANNSTERDHRDVSADGQKASA